MADQKKAGMISGMSPLAVLTGDELMEVSSRQPDGTWKTFSIIVNKIRTNAGLSAYEVAVLNGFQGTQAEWLASLQGKNAYEVAVDLGYVGTEAEWLESLVGASAYDDAVANGYNGTLAEWLESLKGQSAYQLASAGGYVGTETQWLASLNGQSAYELAKVIDPTVGTEAEWLATLVGKSAYQVALANGFVGTESAWLKSLEGKSAFQIYQAIPGNEDKTEAEFLESLKGADGTDGNDGESAYELWVSQPGNAGKTEAEFLTSLKGTDGESAYQIWEAIPENAGKSETEYLESLKGIDGTDGTDGTNGTDGDSAYQIWEAQPDNVGKTEAEFLLSLKGADGKSAYQIAVDEGFVGDETAWVTSLKGEAGQSAYDIWVALPDNVGKSEAEFLESLEGADGESAFEVWQAQAGNAGKTEAEFIASLKGNPGTPGLSAYQVWLAAGNTGTEAQFIASLKGQDGTDGTDGKDGAPINVIATVSQTDFDTIVAEGESASGDAYFVEDFIYVFNGTDWVKSPSLKGPTGSGLNYLGVWPNGQALPLGPTYNPGDTYMWQNNMWTLMEQPTRAWVATGVPGPQGKSAYTVWTEQAGNAGKTEAEFIASLKGNPGDEGPDGPQGKSAFQVWQELPGNAGKTEAEFFVALTGAPGTDGENAVAFTIQGQLSDVSELPIPGEATKAYYVGQNLYVWIDSNDAYENLGSLNGASAYQIWLSQPGNTGTEADFLASLKGKSAFELAVEDGYTGTQAEWLLSLKGTDGTDGTDGKNLQVKGIQANEAAIKALADPVDQDAWIADDTGHLWIYVDTTWIDAGPFRGPAGADGTDGTNGVNGQSTYELWEEQPGNAGKTEAEFLASIKGADGTDGTNGRNVVIKGSVENQAALSQLVNPQPQDAYTTRDLGILYMYISGTWTNLGQFRGDQGVDGEQGPPGQGLTIIAEVETLAERPDPGTLQPGEAVYVLEDHKLYQVNDANVYGPGIQIQGPQGEDGNDGPPGPAGTSIQIMGSYPTEAALVAAHPTGNAGEGYLVGDDLYLYGVNPEGENTEWYNAGPVRGPQGIQGNPGPRGLQGITGATGSRGSLWLVLPDGVDEPSADYGRPGDWAVNSNFDSFYRDEVTGWALIGRLVAGDVNSPLPGLGKVVREGTEWVPLPVDEVTNPVVGTQYVRVGIAGGKTQWATLTIPAAGIPEVPANTTVPQGRTSAGWTPVMALPTGQTAGRRYELLNGSWVTSAVQAAAPSTTATALCYQVAADGTGSWVGVTFDRYSLRQDTSARNGSFTPDFAVQQTFRINGGSGSSATTVTLPSGAAARTFLAVFVVEGNVNKLTFAAGAGTPTLGYNNGITAADIEYGATQTVLTAFWNGFGTWIISKGPSF